MGSVADLDVGTRIGDYRIDHKLGAGGMGTVYHATQPVIEKRVAIKVLHASACENVEAVDRFVQEARAVNRIGHPNIVDVFGFGTAGDGRAFLVMELLIGESLASRMQHAGVSLSEACAILIEITHALEAAHAANIVHRDLKPDNIFLATMTGRPSVKLLDFGIAKLQGSVETTRPGIVIGSPSYISPEMVHGAPVDGRTDIYSLGVVAFELVTGCLPFRANDALAMMAKHAKLKPPRAAQLRPGLPDELDALIAGMLEKAPERRPTLAEVRAGLERTRGVHVSGPVVVPHGPEDTEILGGDPTKVMGSPRDAIPPSRRGRWFVAAAIGALVVGGTAVVISRGSGEPSRPSHAVSSADVGPPATSPTPRIATAPAPPAPDASTGSAPGAAQATSPAPSSVAGPVVASATSRPPVVRTPAPRLPSPRRTPPAPMKPRPAPAAPRPAPAVLDDDAVLSPFERHP